MTNNIINHNDINILGLFHQRLQGFEQDVTNTLKMNYETGMYVCINGIVLMLNKVKYSVNKMPYKKKIKTC